MGVIKGTKQLFGYPAVDELEQILVAESSEDEPSVPAPPRPRRAANQRRCQNIIALQDSITSRRKGGKQARRTENLRELIAMVENEDLEMDFSIFEPSMSVFAELLAEREKMKVWNDFVNLSEEDQAEFLQIGHKATERGVVEDTVNNNGDGLDNTWEQVPPPEDNRSAHPSFSAEECFQKLDKNIRSLLKRRHKPMGLLLSLESDIISFFVEWPTSVYVSRLASSYERLMLHALCQYLNLNSKSFDSEGLRQTQVENSRPTFTAPPVLLSQYLERTL